MCDGSCAIIPPLLLEYYEARIQMLSVFSWKPALEMPRYIEIQILKSVQAFQSRRCHEESWKHVVINSNENF